MASREIFDPIRLLRVGPVLTATVTVTYGFCERLFLGTFPQENVGKEKANAILPAYFESTFKSGISVVLVGYTSTIILGLSNVVGKNSIDSQSLGRACYWAGIGLAALHFTFVPFVATPVKDIIEDRPQGNSVKRLKDWLDVHAIRIALADIPSWACFLAGFLLL